MKSPRWLKRLLLFSLILYVFYQAGPSIAAVFKIGDRQGPVIYEKERHRSQYSTTYEIVHGSKPRVGLVLALSDRPYFYGLERRLKSKEEREAIIEKVSISYAKKLLQEANAAMGE